MRKNNKGFMLIETLLVSVFVVSTLIFVYIQFEKVRNSYQTSFEYNTINGVYNANTILKYLKENGIENLNNTIKSGTTYIDITNCPGGYLSNTSFCYRLLSDLKVKKILYVSSDVTDFKSKMNQAGISNKFKRFVNTIKKTSNTGYRLLIEYADESYTSILAKSDSVKPTPTPTSTPTPSPIKKLSGTTVLTFNTVLRADIDYVVTKDTSTNKATINFNVGSIGGSYSSTIGNSVFVSLSSGGQTKTAYLMYNGTNEYGIGGMDGSISVTKDISMSATSASFVITSTENGVEKDYTVHVTWNDSDLK